MLNKSERRQLAEIDARLRASDPGLARALSRVEEPPHRCSNRDPVAEPPLRQSKPVEEPPYRYSNGAEGPPRRLGTGLWICLAVLLVAPWMGMLDGWPLLLATALTLATLLWGVWLQISLARRA